MKTLFVLFGFCAALLCAGCSTTTPQSRAESQVTKNQALFNTFAPEVQDKVRAGEVDIGFTPAQVWVAWGNPHKRLQEKDINGDKETWVYAKNQARYVSTYDPFYSAGYSRRYRYRPGLNGRSLYDRDFVRVNQAVEVGRVSFVDGVVSSVQVAK